MLAVLAAAAKSFSIFSGSGVIVGVFI